MITWYLERTSGVASLFLIDDLHLFTNTTPASSGRRIFGVMMFIESSTTSSRAAPACFSVWSPITRGFNLHSFSNVDMTATNSTWLNFLPGQTLSLG